MKTKPTIFQSPPARTDSFITLPNGVRFKVQSKPVTPQFNSKALRITFR